MPAPIAPERSSSSPDASKRQLGLATTTSIVLGNMVGSGIFLLPASLAAYGAYSLWGWGFSTVGALLLAWVFSSLSRRMPRAGGPYAYPRHAFGDFAGFLVAWVYWLSILGTNAAIAVAFASYLAVFVPVLAAQPLLGGLVAIAAVWVLTGINIWGVHVAGNMQLVTVVLKITPVLALALFGIFYFDPDLLTTSHVTGSPLSSINTTAAFTMWAFLGLECATVPAGHVKDPEKTIPRATLLGTAIAAAFYILATTVVMGIIPAASLAHSNAPFADAANVLWGSWGSYVIAVAAIISCFGALNGWLLMQGQFPQAVARDGLFPKLFAGNSRRGTPVLGMVFSSVLASILILMNYSHGLVAMFNIIILLTTFFVLMPYMFCAMAEIVLGRGVARVKGIVFSCLAFAFALWASAGTGEDSLYWAMLLMLVGLPIYVWQKREKAVKTA
ncbi:MAG TPA: amino acid permease [Gammaproteobacteria bacterium]|nr:amino acid permease [Gammaproteobacteria bacterium]HET7369341.1 amino acid permease [Gammaproteobacteria bacterium]HET7586797.1 amino acid permease [Gammaproteobacteria bacterium]